MNIPFNGDSAFFLDLYGRYQRNPEAVPADWRLYFEQMDGGESVSSVAARLADDLIRTYRADGHREASLDPLGLSPRAPATSLHRLRESAAAILSKPVTYRLGGQEYRSSLDELTRLLATIYAGSAAIEAAHVEDEEARNWLFEIFERTMLLPDDTALMERILRSVAATDTFESFLQVKFPTKKRFGLEGAETAAVALQEILREAAVAGYEEVLLGGMHRGRLSMLATVLGKPPALLLAEVKGRDLTQGGASFTGDVPYHLGHTAELTFEGRRLRVSISPHPSHLIAVAPVVMGLARARRTQLGELDTVLCFLLHTDAAFSGQGLVAELFQLGGLSGYSVGGTIHLVVNNQIGFTTTPSEGRSSRYCTDVSKATGIPILHVNGEDPVAAARAAQVALAWRQTYRRDIVIDLICYRRNGHNELDEPRFTLPAIWAAIDERESLRNAFTRRISEAYPHVVRTVAEGSTAYKAQLQDAFAASATYKPNRAITIEDSWNGIVVAGEAELLAPVGTGVECEDLQELGRRISAIPVQVRPHPKVEGFYRARLESIESRQGINFATAEALAYASLLAEGVSVRLSGQDSVRGTFTQRHLVVFDMLSGIGAMPLSAAASSKTRIEAINSPLSEYAVLAFEYGHSIADPQRLVLWEAQFGDFLNGAQIAVDQFIVSAEAKWQMMSGLVVLLPHGLEGQGPDHSSARIERLLQLCAGGNIIVANPSTPANLFHLLRRQIHAPWRKPMFVIAPKSLLRHRACVSTLGEMAAGSSFRTIIGGVDAKASQATRIVLCSGKIAYDLEQIITAARIAGRVAVLRVEQLYPFPGDDLRGILDHYPMAREWIWCQEEPENQGAWHFIQDQLSRQALSCALEIQYVGRASLPVAAGGSIERHEREQATIVRCALGLDAEGF